MLKTSEAVIPAHPDKMCDRISDAGSFLGYLYRTLEYSGRGLVPLKKFSLDNFSPITGKRLLETFIKDDLV